MRARLLIVDDHEVVRSGLRSLLCQNPDWCICGEAGNGAEAVELVGELKPDVVVLDLTMPEVNGIDAIERIRQVSPTTKIVVFTMHTIPVTATQVGADAFVSKSSAQTDLARAIEQVLGASA